MRNWLSVLTSFLLIAFVSCTISKRHYRPGFYVEKNKSENTYAASTETERKQHVLVSADSATADSVIHHPVSAANTETNKNSFRSDTVPHSDGKRNAVCEQVSQTSLLLSKKPLAKILTKPRPGLSPRKISPLLIVLGFALIVISAFVFFSGGMPYAGGVLAFMFILGFVLAIVGVVMNNLNKQPKETDSTPHHKEFTAKDKRLAINFIAIPLLIILVLCILAFLLFIMLM